MRLFRFDGAALELRWTWLPWWLVSSPILEAEVNVLVRDVVVLNGMPISDDTLERVERFFLKLVDRRFKIPGLVNYLKAVRGLQE